MRISSSFISSSVSLLALVVLALAGAGNLTLCAQEIPDSPPQYASTDNSAATSSTARPAPLPEATPAPAATAADKPGTGMGPDAPPPEWFKKESYNGQFTIESQDTSANLLLMEAAQQLHELATPFLDLPRPYRHHVYIQARKINDPSEFKPAVIAAGLSRGKLQFRIGIWYPSPQAKEELLRALTTIFIYEKLLADRESWHQGDVLPPLPLWLTEGTLQHLLNPVPNRTFYQIVYRAYSTSRAPKLETIAAWKGLSNDPVYRCWQQTFSYYLVDLAAKGEANETLQDWLVKGANLSLTPVPETSAATTEPPALPVPEISTAPAPPTPQPLIGAPFPQMLTQQQWEKKLLKAEQWSRDLVYSFDQTEAELQIAENMDLEELEPLPDSDKTAKDKEKDKDKDKDKYIAKAKEKTGTASTSSKASGVAPTGSGLSTSTAPPPAPTQEPGTKPPFEPFAYPVPVGKSGIPFPVPPGMHPIVRKPATPRVIKNIISVRIDALASRRNHPGLARAVKAKIEELMLLELRAHFAWRPVLTIYRQALNNLPDPKAKPSYESLIASAGNARKQLVKFKEKVTDYMNWYIVANPLGDTTDVANSTFSEYFEMRRKLEEDDRNSTDPYRKAMLKLLGPDALH